MSRLRDWEPDWAWCAALLGVQLIVFAVLWLALGLRPFVAMGAVLAAALIFAGWWLHTWDRRNARRTWPPRRGPRDRGRT